jgi:rSAM/selenodomain-associated transferase 1
MSKERLIVFVKAPRPGLAKTRIAKTAGSQRAVAIHRELVDAVLGGIGSLPAVELRFMPDDAEPEIRPWVQDGWTSRPQGSGDLGARLARAFAEAFAAGAECVAIIGSDCPEVRTSDVRSAWAELRTHDLVVGPAIDGGYWLIGLRSPQPALFEEITWSSEQVLGQTLQRARALGLRIQLLRILGDIDTEADWNAYVRQRKESASS